MTRHGATRQRWLREWLAVTETMTTVQIQRLGLMPARGPLTLPHCTYTVATRTTQQTSQRDLTFVALDTATLRRHTPAELGHLAGLAEAQWHLLDYQITGVLGLTRDHQWRLVTPAERRQGNRRQHRPGHLPDAEINSPPGALDDWAVEMDAGYPRTRKFEKMQGFAQQGYRHILWVTSVHGLVRPVVAQMQALHDAGELPGVVSGAALFVDYWSTRDPYRSDRRCHTKSLFEHRRFLSPQ